MIISNHINIKMLRTVARRLGPLRERVVFLGGCATYLLITDTAIPEIRPTLDVDVIVEIVSRLEYYKLEKKLQELGFAHPFGSKDPICRWEIEGVTVDIMPTDEKILGFSNRWYKNAITHSTSIFLDDDLEIQMVTAPYFLATKIEAFYGRGRDDFLGSHDMEDIITIIDGRSEMIDEIKMSSSDLRKYLSQEFLKLSNNEFFIESLSGHLRPDKASQARMPLLIERVKKIAASD